MKLYYSLMDKIFDPESDLSNDYKRWQYNKILVESIAGFIAGVIAGYLSRR